MKAIRMSDVKKQDEQRAITTLPDEFAEIHLQIGAGLEQLKHWFPLSSSHVDVSFSINPLGEVRPMWSVWVTGGPRASFQSTLKAALDSIEKQRKNFVDTDELNAMLRELEPYQVSAEEWNWLNQEMNHV